MLSFLICVAVSIAAFGVLDKLTKFLLAVKEVLQNHTLKFSLPPSVESSYPNPLLVVIFLQVLLKGVRDGQGTDAIVRGAAANDGTTDVLEAERPSAMDGVREKWLEEHARVGVLVMLQQARDRGCMENTWVMHVEAEVVVPLLDAGVQRAPVAPEADGEQVVLLGRVTEKEGPLRLTLQERLSLVAVHDAPVTRQVGDLQQVRHQAVDVVDLCVGTMMAILRFEVVRRHE